MSKSSKKSKLRQFASRNLVTLPNSQLPHQADKGLPLTLVAELAVDIWKIKARAVKEEASFRVLAACERAEDRLLSFGFEFETYEGAKFDSNMFVRVLDHKVSDNELTIIECLSPAIYFHGSLIREAEVVIGGEAKLDE